MSRRREVEAAMFFPVPVPAYRNKLLPLLLLALDNQPLKTSHFYNLHFLHKKNTILLPLLLLSSASNFCSLHSSTISKSGSIFASKKETRKKHGVSIKVVDNRTRSHFFSRFRFHFQWFFYFLNPNVRCDFFFFFNFFFVNVLLTRPSGQWFVLKRLFLLLWHL